MNQNHLKLNQDKTVFLPISRQKQFSDVSPIQLGDYAISPAESANNLGFITSSNFSAEAHINKVVQTSFFHLQRLRSIRERVPSQFFKTLVHAFVTIRIDHCNSLYINMPGKLLNKSQNVQNAAAKLILNWRKYDSASLALQKLHWLPVHKRIDFKILVTAYKIFYFQSPTYFSHIIRKKVSVF